MRPETKEFKRDKRCVEKKADDLWRKCLHKRAAINNKGMCEYCHHAVPSQCHHIFGRRQNGVRWLLENGLYLCYHCHAMAHANPKYFITWFSSRYPDRILEIRKYKRKIVIGGTMTITSMRIPMMEEYLRA